MAERHTNGGNHPEQQLHYQCSGWRSVLWLRKRLKLEWEWQESTDAWRRAYQRPSCQTVAPSFLHKHEWLMLYIARLAPITFSAEGLIGSSTRVNRLFPMLPVCEWLHLTEIVAFQVALYFLARQSTGSISNVIAWNKMCNDRIAAKDVFKSFRFVDSVRLSSAQPDSSRVSSDC